jgi:tetratricopeptide (TPR) repeat protein
MKTQAALVFVAALAACTAASAIARADDTPEELFQKGVAALDKGAYQEAIDDFESLSDRGFVHPDASYDRGLAYLGRVRAEAGKPGDLGRAAAAFEEAVRLRPDDDGAARELDVVRREVTRRRSRKGRDDGGDARPTVDRAVVGLLSETTWAALAIAASILVALGLVLRKAPRGAAHVAGSVIAPAAIAALIILTPLAVEARWLGANTRAGVVVAPEVGLLDARGAPLGGPPVPEAASVELGAREGTLVHARWGAREGWLPLASVRVMPR